MVEEFVSFFEQLLGTNSSVTSLESINDMFPIQVFDFHRTNMISSVSSKEVTQATFSIGEDKAPGPDGYSTKLFKEAWGIVGAEVSKAVKDFFIQGRLLKEINATNIALIPKMENLESLRSRGGGDLNPLDFEIERAKQLRKEKKQADFEKSMANTRIVNPNVENQENENENTLEGNAMGGAAVVRRALKDYSSPTIDGCYSSIRRPPVQANNFEIKPAIIQMI
ncbi:uncharacterized protein LOC116121773 [Pistacia vera]|uniref:uncharacterized protein LOC116121773 n=1 Tax=Pistacia vera TaxID=55513 RepID=UPI0012637D36|nr:uncharacterized protein LOC116121773 [Pistacia vera]